MLLHASSARPFCFHDFSTNLITFSLSRNSQLTASDGGERGVKPWAAGVSGGVENVTQCGARCERAHMPSDAMIRNSSDESTVC